MGSTSWFSFVNLPVYGSEINGLFAALKLTKEAAGSVVIEKLTYSRYEVDYDFGAEREARLVTTEDTRDVEFFESDVLAIVVPNTEAKKLLESTLNDNWTSVPTFMEVPA